MKKKITKKVASKKTNKAGKSMMSIEMLSHFNCNECNGWWSIGDAILEDRSEWFCPWCGVKNTFEKFSNK